MAITNFNISHLLMAALGTTRADASALISGRHLERTRGFRLFCNDDYFNQLQILHKYKIIYGSLSPDSLNIIKNTCYDSLEVVAFLVSQEAATLITEHGITINLELIKGWDNALVNQRFHITLSGDENSLLLAKLSMN